MSKTIEGDNGKPLASGGNAINQPKNIWTTVRDNSKATPDAYAEEGNPSFISEFGTANSESLAKLSNLFQGGKNAIGQLSSAMSFMNNVSSAVSSITQGGSIKDILSNVSRGAPGLLSTLGVSEDSPMLKKIQQAQNLVTKVNDTYQRIKNTDFKSVDGLLSLAKDLTGHEDFLGLSTLKNQADYVTGLAREMIHNNIPNSFSAFKDILNKNPYKHEVVKELYPEAIKKQDLPSLQSMVELMGQRKFKQLTSQDNLSGNFTQSLSKNWSKENEKLDTPLTKQYQEIKDTLQKVNGDNWLYQKRGNEDTINIKDYLYSSDRFKEIMNKGVVESNKIKPLTSADVNKEIKDKIRGNANTTIDDEKFLTCLYFNHYVTPKEAIRRDFPRVYIDSTNITL